MKKVLVIDDDSDILDLLEKILLNEGYEVFTEGSAESGLKSFKLNSPDLIFTDIELPGISGLNFLEQIKKENPALPVIVITGTGTMHTSIDASQFDAFEYVEKPLEVDIIKETAKRAIEVGEITDKDDIITAALLGKSLEDDIIGKSDSVKALFKRIGELIKTPRSSPILITGEIGTGKELIAKTIHLKSKESVDSPFLSVGCSALSEEELYALLFGSETIKGKLEEVGSGIHIGDVVVKGDEIYGDGVNVASRIEPLAAPGEICISQDVYNHLRNQSNLKAESMGALNLKNVQFEVQVYKVVIE